MENSLHADRKKITTREIHASLQKFSNPEIGRTAKSLLPKATLSNLKALQQKIQGTKTLAKDTQERAVLQILKTHTGFLPKRPEIAEPQIH